MAFIRHFFPLQVAWCCLPGCSVPVSALSWHVTTNLFGLIPNFAGTKSGLWYGFIFFGDFWIIFAFDHFMDRRVSIDFQVLLMSNRFFCYARLLNWRMFLGFYCLFSFVFKRNTQNLDTVKSFFNFFSLLVLLSVFLFYFSFIEFVCCWPFVHALLVSLLSLSKSKNGRRWVVI